MATNQTEHYALNQWELSDSVVMEEFNADNAKIEQALLDLKASLPKIQIGTFTVTEEHLKDNPCSLTFDFQPRLVILMQETLAAANVPPTVLLYGAPSAVLAYDHDNTHEFRERQFNLTWEGNTLTWYGDYPFPKATFRFMSIALPSGSNA